MQDILTDTKKRGPSSRVQEVIRQAPAENVTVGWLTSTLHRDSFGIVMLCLGVLATTPVGSTVPGLILAVMAVQLIVSRGKPALPHFIMTRRLPTKQLLRLGGLAMHVLKYLEKLVHPRWPRTFEAAKHAVGVMILLLTLVLLLTPVPLSNVAPAMVISLISLAYIEEDGLLLSVGPRAGSQRQHHDHHHRRRQCRWIAARQAGCREARQSRAPARPLTASGRIAARSSNV